MSKHESTIVRGFPDRTELWQELIDLALLAEWMDREGLGRGPIKGHAALAAEPRIFYCSLSAPAGAMCFAGRRRLCARTPTTSCATKCSCSWPSPETKYRIPRLFAVARTKTSSAFRFI